MSKINTKKPILMTSSHHDSTLVVIQSRWAMLKMQFQVSMMPLPVNWLSRRGSARKLIFSSQPRNRAKALVEMDWA